MRIDPYGRYDNNRIYGFYFGDGGYTPTSAADFSFDTAAYLLKGKLVASPDVAGRQGSWWRATSDRGEGPQDIMEPIPGVAWLFALGVIGLVALKRRRKRG